MNVHEIWVDVIFHDPWNCSAQGGVVTSLTVFRKLGNFAALPP